MKQLLWIGLLASATSADTALSSFEFVGNGFCAVTAGCTDFESCVHSSFCRGTGGGSRPTYTEDCARDALNAGARGFTVKSVNSSTYYLCRLHPQQDPELPNKTFCRQNFYGCPARSPYGSYNGVYDWQWSFLSNAVVGPIQGVLPNSDLECYRAAEPAPSDNPTENPTEAPTENPTEVPTENPTENPTGVCCKEINAECLSGLTGVTEEEFCDAFPGTLGCTVCCKAFTAECLSCQLGLTVEEFCIANPSTPGCTDPCREYRHKGSCRKQRNCIWKKVDKKCMTG